jgi:hypothetical protein
MLSSPAVRELRTPQGCLSPADTHVRFNTGVWAIAPSRAVYDDLTTWLASPRRADDLECSIGFQPAANLFFQGPRQSLRHTRAAALHVGYNAKHRARLPEGTTADDVAHCLQRHNLSRPDLHVVHWSGRAKPQTMCTRRGCLRGQDPIEYSARQAYAARYYAALDSLGCRSASSSRTAHGVSCK